MLNWTQTTDSEWGLAKCSNLINDTRLRGYFFILVPILTDLNVRAAPFWHMRLSVVGQIWLNHCKFRAQNV